MKPSILFFGSDYFSSTSLTHLLKDSRFNIAGIITTGNSPKIETPYTTVIQHAKDNSIPLYFANTRKELLSLEKDLSSLQPDFAISASFGVIIPKQIYTISKHPMMNIHPSLLPKYRGPSPLQNQLIDGITETGVTIITMAEDVDAGDILAIAPYTSQKNDTTLSLGTTLFSMGTKHAINLMTDTNAFSRAKTQDHELATFTRKYSKEDAQINWANTPTDINNHIRAFYPKPIAWTLLSDLVLKFTENKTEIPKKWYTIRVQILSGKIIGNQYYPNTLRIEGKNTITWEQFCQGYL